MRSPDNFRTLVFGHRHKWQKVKIQIFARTDDEVNETMWELADRLFDHSRAALYCARYTMTGSPIIFVYIAVELSWTLSHYIEFFEKKKRKDHRKCKVISIEEAGGSDPHAFAYLLGRSLRGGGETILKDTTHWLFNMMGIGYAAEAKLHCEMGAKMIENLMQLEMLRDREEPVYAEEIQPKGKHAKR